MLKQAYIPYRGYYSSPFSKWQGTLANEHAIILAADTTKRWLSEKGWDPGMYDFVFLGMTVGQPQWFYGGPWASALIGATASPGIHLSQACSTSTTCIYMGSMGIETGLYQTVHMLCTDRCSNEPHTVWPSNGPGGTVVHENSVTYNFGHDPWAENAMIQTAENVAREVGISREECDELTLRRYKQYMEGLANDRAFQKRYMYPVEVRISRKETIMLQADEGITHSTPEGLARLKPVQPDGILTFGGQTHPADGHISLTVTTREKARELSDDPEIEIQVVSYGYARAKKGYMPMAVVPAAKMALENAGITIDDVKTVKTHNPFVVNDIYLAREFGIDAMEFNNFGSPLIYGHPQSPTAGRCIIEGIEEVVMAGGGYLLFSGCAAGDTGAALVLKIR